MYTESKIEIINFETEDIITTGGERPYGPVPPTDIDPIEGRF